MAFRASNIIPQRGYDNAKALALRLQNHASVWKSEVDGGTSADRLLQLLQSLSGYRDELNAIKAIPGIVAYAKDQEDDQAYDVAGEFNALKQLVEDAALWIRDNMPGYPNDLTVLQLNVQGERVWDTFTGAQLAGLSTDLQQIIDGVS